MTWWPFVAKNDDEKQEIARLKAKLVSRELYIKELETTLRYIIDSVDETLKQGEANGDSLD